MLCLLPSTLLPFHRLNSPSSRIFSVITIYHSIGRGSVVFGCGRAVSEDPGVTWPRGVTSAADSSLDGSPTTTTRRLRAHGCRRTPWLERTGSRSGRLYRGGPYI
mmetsp:Transcript_11556/g.20902  ORF Transcript_11556/g.20902 Transcript_11556/m.20902 type:complete len:105 (+) Transcript_11556:57-371(+)